VFCWEPAHETAQLSADELAKVNADARYQQIPWARMLGILAITIVGSVMFYATITQNANAFVALGVTNPAEIGSWATLASIGVPMGTILFWFCGRLHIGLLLALEFILIGAGFTFMASATAPLEYVWAAGVQQIGCGMILPTLLVWATRGLAYQIRGRGKGLWQGAFGLGLFVSGAALQFLSEQFGGSMLLAFGMLGKVSLAAAIVAIVAKLIWGKNAIPARVGEAPAAH
jgi:MFS family permease